MSQTSSQADTMHRVVQTALPFARAVAAFESELGLWHLDGARKAMREGVSRADLDTYIGTMSGPHGLMVLATTDLPSALLASLGRPELDSFGASLDAKMATVVDHVIAKG